MAISRRDEIKRYIEANGEASLARLQEIFPDVSSMTLRRDLIRLEEDGAIKRTRGGAVAINRLTGGIEGIYSQRANENVSGKLAIANAAAKLIGTGHSLYIDSGSTLMYFAKALPDEHFPILTSGLNIALELMRNPKYNVTILGGQVNPNTLSASGHTTTDYISDVNIDVAVMATSGFDPQTGFTSGSYTENELKCAVIKKARSVIMLMDSTKVGRFMPLTFAQLADINILVTDYPDCKALRVSCEEAGVRLVEINAE